MSEEQLLKMEQEQLMKKIELAKRASKLIPGEKVNAMSNESF